MTHTHWHDCYYPVPPSLISLSLSLSEYHLYYYYCYYSTTYYTNMCVLLRSVFGNADSFNADIGAWDTSAATDMYSSEYYVVFY